VSLGATLDDWAHLDLVLGLGANLLPCVPASPDVKVLEGSALAGKIGKIPSMFSARGEAHGLLNWTKREITPSEVAEWSKDRRLNICLRTGPISSVYGIDIDVDDRAQAEEIVQLIEQQLGVKLPKRYRENSGKCLLLFRMEHAQ
jgi:Bifunctional DNA primase/polymerase, N-terminal